jgi:hypothetical protein
MLINIFFLLTFFLSLSNSWAQSSNEFETELLKLEKEALQLENDQMNAVMNLEANDSNETQSEMIEDRVSEGKSGLKKTNQQGNLKDIPVPLTPEFLLIPEHKSLQKRRRIPSR